MRNSRSVAGTGVLKDGRVTWDDPKGFTRELREFGDGSIVATVKHSSAAEVRSLKANAYYWSQVLTVMSEAHSAGDQSPEEIHDAMCTLFLPDEKKRVEFFNRTTGEVLAVESDTRRSSKLKGREFYVFVEKVRKFAAEFLHVETQDPDLEYWHRRAA